MTWGDLGALSDERKAIIVFVGVLPLINGLFDALSYAVTLATMRKGLATPAAFGLAVVDLAIAAGLFVVLGAAMVVVIAGLNAVGAMAGNAPLFDLGALFAGLRDDPGAYWWLGMILFSTLLPTALHLLIATLALQGMFSTRSFRKRMAAWIDRSPASPACAIRGFLAQATLWWAPVMALGVVGWLAWIWLGDALGTVGLWYVGVLSSLAQWIGAL